MRMKRMGKKEEKNKIPVKVGTAFTEMSRNAVRKLRKSAAQRKKAKAKNQERGF